MPKKPVKKTTVKKTATRAVKSVAMPKPTVTEIPAPDPYCHCTKRKRTVILTCTFIAGFAISQIFFCGCRHEHMPRPQFTNGCLDTASVRCPKLLSELPVIDANHDGCITKQELRSAKKAMRRNKRRAPVEEPAVVDAIAPVME